MNINIKRLDSDIINIKYPIVFLFRLSSIYI
jgi:hypothetical protein